MRLDNKVAIITGGGKGIGRMICLTMAREGASISVVDINAENANETANHIEKENRNALPIVVDVTIKSQVDAMVIKTIKQFGKIDILVNNAGIVAVEPIISMKEKTWDDVMKVNAKSMFLCSQEVANAALFLASDEADYITGIGLNVAGGSALL